MKKYFVFALLLLSPLTHAADFDSLVVRGEAEVKVKPEILRLEVEIVGKAKTAKAAQTLNAEESARAMNVLKKMHIDDRDIQTENYSVNAWYEYVKTKRILNGYTATHSLQVTLRDLGQASALMDALVDGQESEEKSVTIGSTHYDTEKQREYEREALTDAMANAKQRAEVLAHAAGKKLQDVRHISDSQVSLRNPTPMRLARGAMMEADMSAAPELSPGEIIVTSSVTVEYAF